MGAIPHRDDRSPSQIRQLRIGKALDTATELIARWLVDEAGRACTELAVLLPRPGAANGPAALPLSQRRSAVATGQRASPPTRSPPASRGRACPMKPSFSANAPFGFLPSRMRSSSPTCGDWSVRFSTVRETRTPDSGAGPARRPPRLGCRASARIRSLGC